MSSVLVTGGTGTFGHAFVRWALQQDWRRVVVFSRDEQKQAQLQVKAASWPGSDKLRCLLGDVRDHRRLLEVLRDVRDVVHAAALKRVDAGAYAPGEIYRTNINGTMNVVDAAIACGCKRVIVISSDKAVHATNIYGASKFCAETFGVQQNSIGVPSGTMIAAVRYGNVLGSRGSVIHIWRDQLAAGRPITITDVRMTRFIMTIEQAVTLVGDALASMRGGEVFVPVLPSATMIDLAAAVMQEQAPLFADRFADGQWYRITGLRPGGEKLAEQLLNEEEPARTVRLGNTYVVLPSHHEWTDGHDWPWQTMERLPADFVYRSDTESNRWLSALDLAALMADTEACR